jgi:hypothetical protein
MADIKTGKGTFLGAGKVCFCARKKSHTLKTQLPTHKTKTQINIMTQSKSYATALLGLILLLSPSTTDAFAPSSSTVVSRAAQHPAAAAARRAVVVFAADADGAADAVVGGGGGSSSSSSSRRDVLARTLAAAMTASGTAFLGPFAAPAAADDAPPPAGTVVVAGATGQTGRRILERLASSSPSASVVAGVRDVNRAKKSLSESSTVVRGAMIQKVDSVSTSGGLELRHLDVSIDTVDEMAKTLSGATYLVIAVGFVPGNPLRMNAAAHEVDNVGTCKLIVSGVFLSFSRPFPSSCRPFGRLDRHASVGFGGTPCGGGGVIFVLVRFESAAVGADLVFALSGYYSLSLLPG